MFISYIINRVNLEKTDSHDDDEKLVLDAKKNHTDFNKKLREMIK